MSLQKILIVTGFLVLLEFSAVCAFISLLNKYELKTVEISVCERVKASLVLPVMTIIATVAVLLLH